MVIGPRDREKSKARRARALLFPIPRANYHFHEDLLGIISIIMESTLRSLSLILIYIKVLIFVLTYFKRIS